MDLVALLETRKLRGRLLIAAVTSALVTLACLGLLLSSFPEQAPLPGPLASHHAHLVTRCESCHAGSLTAVQGLEHGLVPTSVDFAQSALCLECHQPGPEPMQAHGLAGEVLENGCGGPPAAPGDHAHALTGVPRGPGGELACSTCHVEHRGRETDLAELDDRRCQVCHETTFVSFADHPTLENYPFRRRTRLIFDHRSHIRRHFPADESGAAPGDCAACHRMDRAGVGMGVADYRTACSDCHEGQILGSTQVEGRGLSFLSLPALDLLGLEERGIDIGPWAADSFLVETPMAPFMEVLLSANGGTVEDLASLGEVDLLDLTEATDEQLNAVARVAQEVRELLGEIETHGQRAILERLQALRGEELDPEFSQALLAHLPEESMRAAVRAWLPDSSAWTDEPVDPDRDRAHEEWVETGGWYRSDLDYSLRYRPTGHADPFLESWLDLLASLPGTSAAFDELSRPEAVGVCTKCHSVEATGSSGPGPFMIRWRAAPSPAGDGLTRFAHRAHLANPAENTCLECHRLEPETDEYLSSFRRDAHGFGTNFEPMTLQDCARCHGERRAAAGCLTCHSYHSTSRSSTGRSLLSAAR